MNSEAVKDIGGVAPRSRKQVWFRVAAVLLALLPFVLLEGALRLFDVGRPSGQADPLAGFSRQMPLFEKAGPVYRTVRSREPIFNAQEFKAEKPANGFRVFCFGGSTIYGHPYLSDTALPKWLEIELQATHPNRTVEVINCGGVSYASYRLAVIVKEVLQYQPDLVVVATGENEFLEDRTYQSIRSRSTMRRWLEDKAFSLRTVTLVLKWMGRDQPTQLNAGKDAVGPQLGAEVKPRLDDARTGYASYHRDDAWRRQVVNQFEDSMRAMIADCQEAKVPIFLIALGSNLRDCPPYKSEHKPGVTAEQEAQWQSLFDAASDAEIHDLKKALDLYRKAEAIDGEFGLMTFRIARCLDRMGQVDQARAYYLRAKDQDVCPLRMLEEVYQLQYKIAGETKTPLVDFRKLLEARSPDGIPGNNLYLDHVHPSLVGDQLMAQAVASTIHDQKLLPALPWPAEARRVAYHKHYQTLDASYISNGRRRVDWLENWARRQRLTYETLPKDTRGFLHQGFRFLDFGAADEAWKSFQAALEQDPTVSRKILGHALELGDAGRPEAARDLLQRLATAVNDGAVKADIEKAAKELAGG